MYRALVEHGGILFVVVVVVFGFLLFCFVCFLSKMKEKEAESSG